MGLVTLTKSLTSNTPALGSDVLTNDQSIVAAVNGNLDDSNINTAAAIKGSKLSNVAGSRVPSDRIEDAAVTTAKLADLGVTTAKIADVNVTKAKLATASVTLDKSAVTIQTIAFTALDVAGMTGRTPQFWGMTVSKFVNGANFNVTLSVIMANNAGPVFTGYYAANFVPGTALPTATTEILSMYVDNLATAANQVSGRIVVISILRS